MIVGLMGRTIMTWIRTPFDIVKQQLQLHGMGATRRNLNPNPDLNLPVNMRATRSIRSVIHEIGLQHGARGYFNGFFITVARDMIFSGSYFASYEFLKWVQRGWFPYDEVKHMLAGGTAGVVGTVLSIPIDVVKTRMQTQISLAPAERYKGVFDCIKSIWKKEGPSTFLKGLGPRLVQTIPSASLTFMIYEKIKYFIDTTG
eukprot:TRINITY_DN671_c0_g1_i4.p1 TRINITY_DN671_c0_g1~~TRINITY_DN671_c0_g1_i4.p1  ORF type:complete len:201 (+),score=29.84 TRINITY_DN671_c0_g1_i4:424-1026(+)